MDNTPHKVSYCNQLVKLKEIIDTANCRLISDTPDSFFQENANFFTKSFLVIMCAYLESYLKDALMVIVDETNNKLATHYIPHNLIKWSFNIDKEFKDNDSKIEPLKLKIKKKELDDFISGNPFKTKDLFKKFGIVLDNNANFNNQKEIINSIITKRNKVVHHNDEASDISNKDLKDYIDAILDYISNIDNLVCSQVN